MMEHARIANEQAALESAFSLLYKNYLSAGFITPNPAQVHFKPVFGYENARTIVAGTEAVTGTLTVVPQGKFPLPIEELYPHEIDPLRQDGRRVGEVTGLAISALRVRDSVATFNHLTRFLFQYAIWLGLDDLVITIHPRKEGFYQRRFGYQRFGPVRSHPGVLAQPAIPCRVDLARVRETMPQDVYEKHFAQEIPREMFFVPGISNHLAGHFWRLVLGADRAAG